MSRFGVPVVATILAAVLGCGPGKELPDEVLKVAPPIEPAADPGGKAPAASDPAAKAVLDRAVKVITNNTPGVHEKAKTSVVRYRGVVHFPTPNGNVQDEDTSLRWEVLWPDHSLVTYEFKDRTQTFHLTRGIGWMVNRGQEFAANPKETGRFLLGELRAQHGVYSGLTFADPRAIAFDAKPTTNPAGTLVKIALPDAPVLQVTFEEKTGLPVRVEYHPLENGYRVKKVLALSAHRTESGLLVPGQIELEQNNKPAEKWKLEKWEFPDKIDEAKFSPPKQRAPGG